MRHRINAKAICSSKDYSLSRRVHLNYLKEVHSEYISGKMDFSEEDYSPRYKYVTVWGKRIKLTLEEYDDYTRYQ